VLKCELGPSVPVKDGTSRTGLTAVAAKQMIIDAGLWTPGKPKSKSTSPNEVVLPKKTLTPKDLDGTDDQIVARALAVARELGDTTARGRIGSLNFMIEGVNKFEDWWSRAPSPQRVRLLTDQKNFDKMTVEQKSKIARLVTQPPFRGTVPTPKEEEGEEDA